MMVDDSDNSELKLVDFGLSKILGPNETSTEPFGTLVTLIIIISIKTLVLCGTRSLASKALR
jgi:hypothetical protein